VLLGLFSTSGPSSSPNVVVTAIPYLVGHAYRLRDLLDHDNDIDEDDVDGVIPAQAAHS
jgi:hypothetical protein